MTVYQKLLKSDGTWDKFQQDWESQCKEFDEPFLEYATATFSVVEDLLEGGKKTAGAYAFFNGKKHGSMCQINVTGLPGYNSVVMRIRHLIVSPYFDFGDTSVDEYAMLMARTLVGILNLSESEEMSAKYINIHLRSPADRPFFSALGAALNGKDEFASVQTKGSWLYITKS